MSDATHTDGATADNSDRPGEPGVPSVKRGTVFAWSLWDWGSASFQAVVTTFVFSVYLTSGLFGDGDEVSAQLGTALTIAGVIIALTAPVTGRVSDVSGNRKRWLGINTAVTVIAMALMVFVAPEPSYLMLGLILIAVGNIAFEFASVSYNSMLTQISTPQTFGRISGFGWGMGYFGGIVLLAMVLVGFVLPDVGWFGVTSHESWNIRAAMLLCAIWFAVFALPVFFAVPEVGRKEASTGKSIITAYADLARTIADLWRHHRSTLGFLIASAVFRDGLAGVFTFGAVIAAVSFGFEQTFVLLFGIAANVVSGIATVLGGLLEDRIGAKRIMVWSLVGMVLAALLVLMLAPLGTWVFWVFGLGLTVFVGPVQSASRTYLARSIPPGREGEIFGLYATTGRAVSFMAPAAFTIAVAVSGATIFGILGVAVVLLIGLLLLLTLGSPRSTPKAAGADPDASAA